VLRSLAGSGLALGSLRLSAVGEAKNMHKRRNKKKTPRAQPVFNEFGCLNIGQPCRGDSSLCCSGVCAGDKPKKGKPDRRVCAAHNAGNCSPQRDRCTVQDPVLAECNPSDQFASCLVTTGKAPFCASLLGFNRALQCQPCAKDADCLALNFPPGSACVRLSGQACNGCEATAGRACFPPAIPA